MTEDRVRVLRVLEYEGPRSWVEDTLVNRAVKGERRFACFSDGIACVIREAVIGEATVVPPAARPAPEPKRVYHYSNCPKSNVFDCNCGPCICEARNKGQRQWWL